MNIGLLYVLDSLGYGNLLFPVKLWRRLFKMESVTLVERVIYECVCAAIFHTHPAQ